MKKAGVITHYEVHNHGAVLQLYGMIKELEKLGFDAKALRFNKNYDFIGGDEASKKYNISIKSIPIYIKYALKNGIGRTIYNIKKRKLLNNFRKNEHLIGEFYSTTENLDLVTIGADEIFSIEAGPNPWYYGSGVMCDNIISYAASFGPTTYEMLEKKHMKGMIGGAINELKSISVRDYNSYEIVKKLTERNAEIVCDPVLLYGFEYQLSNEAIDNFKSMLKRKYCIVYSYDYNMNDKETVSSIKKYAKENNLEVISIGYYHKWCDKNMNISPLDVFKWFACSEMVFTDTFHGTVISLTANAQFVTKIRGNSNKLGFLLEQYGVTNRMVSSFDEVFEKELIEYKILNKKIESIRNKSREYLANAVLEVIHEKNINNCSDL